MHISQQTPNEPEESQPTGCRNTEEGGPVLPGGLEHSIWILKVMFKVTSELDLWSGSQAGPCLPRQFPQQPF